MDKYIIYCHRNKINGKRYIGQTKRTPQQRWGHNGYEYIHKQPNSHFASAILKYGWDNFEHQILYTHLTQDEANQKEMELIQLFQTQDNRYGYNLTAGGQSNTLTNEQKQWRSQKNYEMWQDGTFDASISIPVYCVELDLNFKNSVEAAKQTGIDHSSIRKVCKGELNYAGFMPNGQPIHWIYAKDKTLEQIQKLRNRNEIIKGIKIPVECINTHEIFPSSTEAGKNYNISSGTIRSNITGKTKSAGRHPIQLTPLRWKERRDLIQTKGKLTEEIIRRLKQYE